MTKAPVTCAAPRCRVHVEEGKMLCPGHWFALPERLRTALGVTWRARQIAAFQENWTEALLLLDDTPGLFDAARPRRTTPPTIAYARNGEPIIYARGRMM